MAASFTSILTLLLAVRKLLSIILNMSIKKYIYIYMYCSTHTMHVLQAMHGWLCTCPLVYVRSHIQTTLQLSTSIVCNAYISSLHCTCLQLHTQIESSSTCVQ